MIIPPRKKIKQRSQCKSQGRPKSKKLV